MFRMIVCAGAAATIGLGLSLAPAQPARSAETARPSTGLTMMSTTFASTDLDRSVAFYTKGLGLTASHLIENPTSTEVPLFFPGGGVGLLLKRGKGAVGAAAGPRIGRIIVDVPDLKALEARLSAAGYRLSRGILENKQHHVLTAVAQDPDGNELEFVQQPH